VRFGFAALAIILSMTALAPAQTVSCRNYPETVRPLIKPRIEALRLLEREAADRLRGLDTRTFPFLAGEVRKAADLIADPKALKDEEDGVGKCRNAVLPVRAICRSAALVLAAAIDEQEKDAATKESRQAYGEAMPRCEQFMGLQPLSTAWRTTN
jgi:hypothetical protein